jgi:hypothetical protein
MEWPVFRPERCDSAAGEDEKAVGLDGELENLTFADGQDARPLVSGDNVSGRGFNLDGVEQLCETGECNAEQNAADCKNQHDLDQCKSSAHASA